MTASPSILIAMPLFEGWDHVAETLESIRRQTYQNYRVLISVDGGDERSFAACQPYARDPRFEVVLQPDRLRWEGNINWLASRLEQDFFCYWQHDDHCDPGYLSTLMDHATRHPEASSVYCDMQCFGTRNDVIRYPSVTGFALERVLKQAAVNNPAAIRCLIRAEAMRAALPIRLAATWSISLARSGELHRVPQVLYHRRFHPRSLGAQMLARSPEELWAAALDWGLGVVEVARPLVQPDEESRLVSLVVDQLVNRQIRGKWQYDFTNASHTERLRFAAELLLAARQRTGIAPFPEIFAADPRAALAERQASPGRAAGEALLLEALQADLPRFLTAFARGGPPS